MKSLGVLVALFVVVWSQRRPPNYSQEQMPLTSFNCRDKIIGGYYADPETDCQMFHVCVKVPGLGVQDFKFLCPNDTSFDQENQICDDWYNIDCETSTLFYSDNFDLYRIGSEGLNKVRPGNVNNAVTDVEDEIYLHQRNDRGENVGKDLLRGSQSGNFFSNRGGRDEDDEVSKDELYKPKKKTANKTPTRKQLTGKRPVPTQSPSTTTTEAYRGAQQQRGFNSHQGRSFRGNQQTQRTYSSENPTTERQRETEVYQRQRNNYYAPTTQQEQTSTATQRTEFYRTNGFAETQKTGPTTQRPYYDNQNYNAQSTQKTQNFYNGQNYNAPSTQKTQSPYNGQNYNAQTTQKTQNFYNGQNYNAPSTQKTQNPYNGQNYNAQTTQKTQSPYNGQNYNAQTTQKAYSQSTVTTIRPNYNNQYFFNPSTSQTTQKQERYDYNRGTTYRPEYNLPAGSTRRPENTDSRSTRKNFDYSQQESSSRPTQKPSFYNNFNVPSTRQPAEAFNSRTTGGQFNNYNSQPSKNYDLSTSNYNPSTTPDYNDYSSQNTEKTNQYATQKLYKINLSAAVGGFQNNNADRYDEPKDEFLKTAPSQNLAQSNFNRVQSNYNKGYNTSVSSNYNFVTTTKAPATTATVRGRVTYAKTTDATEKPRPFTTPVPHVPKKKEQDQAYDYAYYDDGTASEYDNVENVEEFSRTTARKRST